MWQKNKQWPEMTIMSVTLYIWVSMHHMIFSKVLIFWVFESSSINGKKKFWGVPHLLHIHVYDFFLINLLNKAPNFLEKETPQKSLYFRKQYIQDPSIFRTMKYLEPETYSEQWHRFQIIFRPLPNIYDEMILQKLLPSALYKPKPEK